MEKTNSSGWLYMSLAGIHPAAVAHRSLRRREAGARAGWCPLAPASERESEARQTAVSCGCSASAAAGREAGNFRRGAPVPRFFAAPAHRSRRRRKAGARGVAAGDHRVVRIGGASERRGDPAERPFRVGEESVRKNPPRRTGRCCLRRFHGAPAPHSAPAAPFHR